MYLTVVLNHCGLCMPESSQCLALYEGLYLRFHAGCSLLSWEVPVIPTFGPSHQVKLMRSKERVNSEGVGRSQGYGFVEFATHEAALGALRGTNNNPTLFPSKQRLMVEFAVEDSRVVKIREQRKLKNEVSGFMVSYGHHRLY